MLKTWCWCFCCAISLVHAQEPTRTEEIEKEQSAKAQHLSQEAPGKTEHKFIIAQEIMDRFSTGFNGLRVRLGGLVSGSGFAFGPEYSAPTW